MHVAMVASEAAPFARTGGLGDMIGSLSKALVKRGHRVEVYLPFYRDIAAAHGTVMHGRVVRFPLGTREAEAVVRRFPRDDGTVPRYRFIEHPESFDRDGLYGGAFEDYPDNASRFVVFQRAVLEHIFGSGEVPDIVHVHDWQTALVPLYLRSLYPRLPNLLTIHNLAYQGSFPAQTMELTGLGWSAFHWKGLEFWGRANWLKGGIVFADHLSAVSPTYATEIQTESLGCGLDGVLRERSGDLTGILNGIDVEVWDPASDALLPYRYDAAHLEGKERCKRALQKRTGLAPRPNVPLLGMVARLNEQKGIDLVVDAFPDLMHENVQLVILGVGDPRFERLLAELVERYPGRAAAIFRFDDALAHLIEAGADFFLMPSRFEPCGLNQLYSQRYGTIPIVRLTGGLADSVAPMGTSNGDPRGATGFGFREATATNLRDAVRWAVRMYRESPEAIGTLRRNAMAQDWSWDGSAVAYEELYGRIVDRTRAAEAQAR